MATINTTDPKPGFVYDADTDTWYPLLGISASQSLDELSDVTVSTPTTGQVLAYNGTAWVNSSEAGDISEVVAGTGLSGGGTSGSVTLTNDAVTAIDAAGDLLYGTAADAVTRLGIGTAGQVLKVNSGATAPEWGVDPTTDVVTTAGDLLYGTGADAVTRLGIGTAGQFLAVNSGATAPEWVAAPTSAKNWSLLNSGGTALTGAQTVTISGITNADEIMVLVSEASSANASSIIGVRFNDDTAGNYNVYGKFYIVPSTYASTNISRITSSSTATYFTLAQMAADAGNTVTGYLFLSGGNTPGVKVCHASGASNSQSHNSATSYDVAGFWNNSATITSVSIFSSSGNLDAGTVWVYKSA